MQIRTNIENRKEIVKAVSEITGCPSRYLGVPSCRYQVGECFIDKNGYVETEDEKTGSLVEAGLLERGLVDAPETDRNRLQIKLPFEDVTALNLKNLVFLIHSRQYLINKSAREKFLIVSSSLVEELQGNEIEEVEGVLSALQVYQNENRGFRLTNEEITFLFPYTEDCVRVKAYTDLAAALIRQVREQKRIDPEQRIEENEKYYMRIWLLRIGFGGKEMKESRNTLMANLKGHSAFRTQADIERAKVRTKQRKNEMQTEPEPQSESGDSGEVSDK